MLTNMMKAIDSSRDADSAGAMGVERLHHEIAEDVEEDVAGEHRDEWPQPEAERADKEADQLDRGDHELEDERGVLGDEEGQEVEPVLPETDTKHDREGDQRHDAGEGELRGNCEGVSAGDDPDRHVADEVREEQEDERGEHPRQELLALGPDADVHHVVDKGDQPLDGDLPAAGDQLALHPAEHEQPDHAQDDQRPQRAIGENEGIVVPERARDRLDHELVHRVDFAFGRHLTSLILFAASFPRGLV